MRDCPSLPFHHPRKGPKAPFSAVAHSPIPFYGGLTLVMLVWVCSHDGKWWRKYEAHLGHGCCPTPPPLPCPSASRCPWPLRRHRRVFGGWEAHDQVVVELGGTLVVVVVGQRGRDKAKGRQTSPHPRSSLLSASSAAVLLRPWLPCVPVLA